ncbi:hypothetical protein [Microbispora sp. CA-102843]|uniref:hypothetical protein n=1 Tax=Microbispora sp. CA-102843 TaxID=3239952 RepID=UPI003D8DFCEA
MIATESVDPAAMVKPLSWPGRDIGAVANPLGIVPQECGAVVGDVGRGDLLDT